MSNGKRNIDQSLGSK